MASKEILGRVRHVELASQQRRLRHLRSISARNIVPKFPLHGDSLVDCLLETYFSLHKDENSRAIYTSEKIAYSLNPTWSSFEPSTWSESLETATSSFIVRVWGGQGNRFCIIIEWTINLTFLLYLGDQIRTSHHSPNTLLFGLVDGYYGAQQDSKASNAGPKQGINIAIKVEIDQVVHAYNRSSLLRLTTLQRAICQTHISVQEIRQSIEGKLQRTEKSLQQMAECESLKLKVKLLREELISKHAAITKEREEEKKVLERLRKREHNLERKREELEGHNIALREHNRAHIDKREALVKLNAQLTMRRRQLAAELTYIYPIMELPIKETLICGIKLPNSESEEFYATDDETLSCSLGYACHLVHMISKILELPLRYAMNPMGSRSTIMDFTIDKVAEKDKEFPLHTKGKEKIQFFYAVFLLNKNIAQLRQSCNLGTPNLRNTLPNIKDLLATRFRASADPSPPNSIIRPTPIKGGSNAKSTISSNSSDSRNARIDSEWLKNVKTTITNTKPPLPPDMETTIPSTKPPLPPKPSETVTSSLTKGDARIQSRVDGKDRLNGEDTTSEKGSPSKGSKPPLPPKPQHVVLTNKKNSPTKLRPGISSDNYTSTMNPNSQLQGYLWTSASNNQTIEPQRRSSTPVGVQVGNELKNDAQQGKPRSLTGDGEFKVPAHQSAPHKFLERRPKKASKSSSVPAPVTLKGMREGVRKKRVPGDVRGVPVDILRRRAASDQMVHEENSLDSGLCSAAEISESKCAETRATTGNPPVTCDPSRHDVDISNSVNNSDQFDNASNGEIDLR